MALESATPTLVDAALRSLPIILPVLDFSTIKNDLFPVIANIFSKTNSLAIKVRGLQAFVTLCGGDTGNDDGLDGFAPDRKKSSASALDKYTMQEKIVPLIKVIKTREPAVMMAALTALKVIGQVADAEFVAMDILPILWSMSLGPLLDLKQFQAFMELIKSLSGRVIDEQTKKLQELSTSNNRATSGLNDDFMSFNAIAGSSLDANGTTEADFEMLVKGKTGPSSSHSTNPLESGWDSMSSPVPTVTSPGTTIRSPTTTPSAATFSWSSTPPPAPSLTLKPQQQQQHSFRTVTPDLTHFNTLTPTTTQFSQPLQPTTPSGPINWGTTTTTAPTTTNPWASQPAPPQQPPTNAFGAMSLGGGGVGGGQMSRPAAVPSSSSFSLPPPPGGGGGGAKGLSGFSLAPPPGAAAGPQASAFGVPSAAVASLQGNMGAGMGMNALGGGGMGGGMGLGSGGMGLNSMGSLMNNRGGMGMGTAGGGGMGMAASSGGMGMGMMAQQQQQQQRPQQQQQQQQQGQKSGLAKYESLL